MESRMKKFIHLYIYYTYIYTYIKNIIILYNFNDHEIFICDLKFYNK